MFTTLVTSTLIFALALTGAQAEFRIDTPQLTQCQDVHVTWEPTTPPYNLIVVPHDNPCDAVVQDLGDHQGTSITWKVGIPAGSQVMFSLVDATGEEAWSGAMTVEKSTDTSCLNPASLPHTSLPYSSPATTLVVDKTSHVSVPAPSNSPAIVGAANAGYGPSSGAPSVRQFSSAAFALTALAAVAAFSL